MIRNQRGFSIIEGLVGAALIGGLGVGVMKMSQTSMVSQRGQGGANEISRDLEMLRAFVEDPAACTANFVGKEVNKNTTLTALLNAKGVEMMKVDSMMANNSYKLTRIEIGKHNPQASRTEVHFTFSKMEKEGRAASTRRTFQIFTKVTGSMISECIDPLKNIADGALKQTCMDADPAKRAICEENIINLAEEVKQYYCSSHPYLSYDPVTKKCRPLDAGKNCPTGTYIQGWNANGSLKCYAGPPLTPPAPSTCTSWTAWTPSPATECPGTNVVQTRTCLTPGVSDSDAQTVDGTKATGCQSLNCSISYLAYHSDRTSPTAANGAWAVWGGNGVDRECDAGPLCGMRMAIACTGPTRVRLKYQYRQGTQAPEVQTDWSNPTGTVVWGPDSKTYNSIHDECDNSVGCGLRVVAETEDTAYKCDTSYQYHNEKDYGLTALQSNGTWSSKRIDAGDDNCEKGWRCGIRATISCQKL